MFDFKAQLLIASVRCPDCEEPDGQLIGGRWRLVCSPCDDCGGEGRDSDGNECQNCQGEGYCACCRCGGSGSVQASRKTSSALTSQQLQRIRDIQEEVKAEMMEVSGQHTGGCHLASELLWMEFGWDRVAGDYGETPHYWNTLPDGTVVDATHGQFGQPDLGVFAQGSIEAGRYHPYCSDPLCRHCEKMEYRYPCLNRD